MRTLAALSVVGLSLVGVQAQAAEYTCTCVATNTCSLRWGKQNSVRNVPENTVITRMQRLTYTVGIGAPGGGGPGYLFQGPFAVDAYGKDPSEGEIPPMTTVRISGERNMALWQCIEEKVAPPPPVSGPSKETFDVTTLDGMGRTSLHRAAKAGDEVLVRKLIAAGAVVSLKDGGGDTSMHAAVRGNHVAAVKFLIEAGANPNESSPIDDRPPLHVAVDKRWVDMTKQLLDQGAKPNKDTMWVAANSGMLELIEPQIDKGGDAQLVLGVLIEKKNQSTLDALLARGIRPSDEVTRKAADSDNPEIIESILGAGGNATVVLDAAMERKDAKLATLALAKGAKPGNWLGEAVIMSDLALVSTMLDRGASAQTGMTAAVNTSQIDMAGVLLERGASGGPPALISMAASKGDLPMVSLLLDKGAVADNGMESATKTGHATVVSVLLERGADGTKGEHMASASTGGHIKVVDLLLGAGGEAEPGMVPACKSGHTPVLVRLIASGGNGAGKECMVQAVTQSHSPVVTLLLQHDAKTDWVVGRKEQTLLHIAADTRSSDVTQTLLTAGASVEKTDKDGETPLHAAGRAKNNVTVIEMLIKNGADMNAANAKGRSVYKVANGGKNKKFLKGEGAVK